MIEIQNLTKEFKKPIRKEGVIGMFKTLFSRKYETKVAVNHINLKINDGEIVGYIGSNGAGKSTSIKMMCGILTPSEGKVLIDGIEPYKKRKQIANRIGVVFGQKTQLWWDIPLIETFKVLKEVYQISDEDYKERIEFLSSTLDINNFINQPVRTLSLGQRMRADFAASLIHNPKILYLDEPTIGLDVLVKDKIRKAIKILNKKYKTTIILTTHDMKDIEELCSRIIIIDKGKILYDGNLENIKYKFGNIKTIIFKNNTKFNKDELIKEFKKISIKENDSNDILISFSLNEVNLDNLLLSLINKYKVEDFKINDISIEDITKELYENSKEN